MVCKIEISGGKILHIIRAGKYTDQKETKKILESIKNRLDIDAIIQQAGKV